MIYKKVLFIPDLSTSKYQDTIHYLEEFFYINISDLNNFNRLILRTSINEIGNQKIIYNNNSKEQNYLIIISKYLFFNPKILQNILTKEKFMTNITLISGCMFSGKTTKLIEIYKQKKNQDKDCLLLKPSNDTRYDKDFIQTHNKEKIEAVNIPFDNPAYIFELLNNIHYSSYPEYIFIDEINLFQSKDLPIIIGKLALRFNVILAGLLFDFRKEYFPEVKKIHDFATENIKLNAVCSCGNSARHTQRFLNINNELVPAKKNDEVILVGGADLYKAVCSDCYILG